MSSSLEKQVKNLSDNDFKYFTKESIFKNLELLKQKHAYPYEYMDSFLKDLMKKNCLIKMGTSDDNGEKLDGHISD